MRWLIALALPAFVLTQCISDDDHQVTNDSSANIALFKGQQRFSVDFLRIMNEERKDENIFFSPHSIYQSLLMAYLASANETETLLRNALYLPPSQSKVDTLHAYGMEKAMRAMRAASEADYQYNIANKVFVAEGLEVRPCMANLLKDELEKVDFRNNPGDALEMINTWVSNYTDNHITQILPPDAVSADTSAILANAAYFKGLWKSKFLSEMTKKNDVFYSSTSLLRHVDMMRQKGTFNHMISETLKAHILELPYKGADVSMILVLPRFENHAIDKLISQLTHETLHEILDSDTFYPRPMEVEIPKFTVEDTIDLRMPLQKLGLSSVLSDEADFSTLTDNATVRFTDARHKAKVEVDEEGTEAAAATAVFSFRSSRPLDPTIFRANHPFVYLIFDKVSQNILFMGAYKLPATPSKKAFMKKMKL